MGSDRSASWRPLLGPVIGGLLARLALIAWTSPLELTSDEYRFWSLATTRMAGTGFLPPLYPMFLAALRSFLGDGVTTVRVAGALLSTASIAMVYSLGERHLGSGSGRVSAWIVAFLPALVYFDGRLRSESLTILLLLGLALLWTAERRREGRTILAAGLVLGLILLIRPEFILLPLILLGLELGREMDWRVVRRGLLLVPGIALLVLPWMARNTRVIDAWSVSANAGYNFWKSFNSSTDGSQVPVTDLSIWDDVPEAQMDGLGFRQGLSYILEHPARSLLLIPAKWVHLFGPERDFLSDVRRGTYPRRSLLVDLLFALTQNACWAALLCGGLFAALGPSRSGVKDMIVAVLATLMIVHGVFFGDDRFHMPLLPFLCVGLPEAWDGSVRPRATLRLLGLALALEAVGWCLIVARDAGHIASLLGG